jgi:hypothetical protein
MIRESYRRLKSALSPLQPIYDAWMAVIAAFSWLLARIVLTILFFTAFLIYGVVLRIVRRDPMRRSLDPDRESYWGDNIVSNDELADYEVLY